MPDGLLERLAAEPSRAGLVLDVDGTLAPIVARPDDASVPAETRRELERLSRRYALVACLSGRAGDDAERVVGVSGIRYVGNHGLELDSRADRWREQLREFGSTVDWPVEDKGLTLSFHFRLAGEDAALAYLRAVASEAERVGLQARFGRKVLELRPPLAVDKGTAVVRLLEERGLRRALYGGDDTTDLDAFRGLEEARLELAVRVAVSSDEGPPELTRRADLVVAGPAGMLDLLRAL